MVHIRDGENWWVFDGGELNNFTCGPINVNGVVVALFGWSGFGCLMSADLAASSTTSRLGPSISLIKQRIADSMLEF